MNLSRFWFRGDGKALWQSSSGLESASSKPESYIHLYHLYSLGCTITSLGLHFLICEEKVITTYLTGLLGEVNETVRVKPFAQCLAQNQLS